MGLHREQHTTMDKLRSETLPIDKNYLHKIDGMVSRLNNTVGVAKRKDRVFSFLVPPIDNSNRQIAGLSSP